MKFCDLHNHTEFTNEKLRDSIVKIQDLVDRAIEHGSKGVAITDHEVLSGHVQALEIAEKTKKKHPEFKVMLGNEIYLIDETEYRNAPKLFHFILIAKNRRGHDQLRELSSRAWERSYAGGGQTRTPTFYQDIEEIIGQDKGHLISLTACLGGKLAQSILQGDSKTTGEFILWMQNNFGKENCFLEMQDSDSEEQQIVNKGILKASEYFGIDYVVTSDTHYLNKEDFGVHHAFLNSKEEKERETESFYKHTYLKSVEEKREILNYLPKEVVDRALSNTMKVYDMVEDYDIRHEVIVPEIKIPDIDLTCSSSFVLCADGYEYINKFINSPYEQDRFLIYSANQGLTAKGFHVSSSEKIKEIFDRFELELEVLWVISEFHKQRMSAYLNLVKRIIDIIWEVSFIGPGRGSAGAFLINYFIGITQLNPLDYNLPYWRFLNLERLDDFPDIDIDVNPEKADEILALLRKEFGDNRVLSTITFKTESLKSAILTAARGLDIPLEEAQTISAMVPIERGKVASLKACLGEKEDIPEVANFRASLEKFPYFLETVRKIEGLISGRGSHASSIYIFNNDYVTQNSLMKAPNGVDITAFNMHDSDKMGALKFDLLKVDCLTKVMKCFELLLKDGLIEWQDSLRSTYEKYISSESINLENEAMWENINSGKVMNLFQFETQVGSVGLQKVKPQTLSELSLVNDGMRLQGTLGGLTPVERLASYKEDVSLWYKEMQKEGLSSEEVVVLERYLLPTFGNSINQETLMQLVMDSKISNFTLGQSNSARKILAKKQVDKVEELRQLFYKKGEEAGARTVFLDYTWKYMVEPQMSYSFSVVHSTFYAFIAAQEAHLSTVYNPLYWICACLSVNAGSAETDFEEFGDESEDDGSDNDSYETTEEEAETSDYKKNTNYGKVAKAIGEVQARGIEVLLPEANKAEADFIPDVERNAIFYGLQSITSVNTEMIESIIAGRPYSSLEDFMDKNEFTNVQMIHLVKAGMFDEIEGKSRAVIMNKYLTLSAESRTQRKTKLTMANMPKILQYGILPKSFEMTVKLYHFRKWIETHCFERVPVTMKNKKTRQERRYMLTDTDTLKFFSVIIADSLKIGSDYDTIPKGFSLKYAAFDRFYKEYTEPLREWFETEEALDIFYKAEVQALVTEWKDKYCQGSLSKWEMDAVSYYHAPHELAKVRADTYGLKNFENLPATPVPLRYRISKKTGIEYPVYDLVRIAGTVLNADKNKHIVSILTVHGVVDVKFFREMFIHYNKRVSEPLPNGKTTIIEKSWFTRGNKLFITGYRRENMFLPRRDYERKMNAVQLIEEVSNGALILKTERERPKTQETRKDD